MTTQKRKHFFPVALAGALFSVFFLSPPFLAMAESPALAFFTSADISDEVLRKIAPDLLDEFDSKAKDRDISDVRSDFFVWFGEKADLSQAATLRTKEEKGRFVFEALRDTADRTQEDLRAHLDNEGMEYRPFYISNKILVRQGSLSLMAALAAHSSAVYVVANHRHQLQKPFESSRKRTGTSGVEPNLRLVNADDVWEMGITGEGVVVAGNDTGVDETHPALARQYRGQNGSSVDHNYNWWDATGVYPNDPDDGNGHGTHTTGTMVGDDGEGNQIGMAPGARYVHCKNMDDEGGGDDGTFIECFEWDLAPWDMTYTGPGTGNPRPEMAPDVVNNSWGYWGGNYPEFRDEIAALQAAGILMEFSAGNDGEYCGSLGSPGDYAEVLTTGSVHYDDGILPGSLSYFSSRGPSLLNPDDTFPDIMAPGEAIRSCVPGGYDIYDGTSMAGPHVTGLVALMWSANPSLQGMIGETVQIIRETAVPLTGQEGSRCSSDGDYLDGPNNDWGYGTIDALAAVESALAFGGLAEIRGTISDSATSAPISGAKIQVTHLTRARSRSAVSDLCGEYQVNLVSGDCDATVSAYGYLPGEASHVSIAPESANTLDFSLEPAGKARISGSIKDATKGWPLYARVDITADGFSTSVFSNPKDGTYAAELFQETEYSLTVTAVVGGYQTETRTFVPPGNGITENIRLDGTCGAPGYEKTLLLSEGFDACTLPAGWSNITNLGDDEVQQPFRTWAFDAPGWWENETGGEGCFATADSDFLGWKNMDTELWSPVVDCSALSNLTLAFRYYFPSYGSDEICDVDVSNDSGVTWLNVWQKSGGYDDGPETVSLDISSHAAGHSNVRIRFHYYNARYDLCWQVDEVMLHTGSPPSSGGLLIGTLRDANTGEGLSDIATIDDGRGRTTSTFATPDDPNAEDGFYCLFLPPGSHDLSIGGVGDYGQEHQRIRVVNMEIVEKDFHLPAGFLGTNPPEIEVTLHANRAENYALPITMENLGGFPAEFEIAERNRPVAEFVLPESRTQASGYISYWDESEVSRKEEAIVKSSDGSLRKQTLFQENMGAEIPTGPRYRSASTNCDCGACYIFGGWNEDRWNGDGEVLNEAWKYVPESDSWTRLADMPVPLTNMQAVCISDYICLVGGYTGTAHTDHFLIYDTIDDLWTSAAWPNIRTPMITTWNGRLYAFGGNPGPSNETWVFDPAMGKWDGPLSPMPVAVCYGSAVATDDAIYVIGGSAKMIPQNAVQRYDPTRDTWDKNGPQLQDARMSPLTVLADNHIHVISGGGKDGDIWKAWETVEMWDPALWPEGSWTYHAEELSYPAVGMAGACMAGQIWAVGGTQDEDVYDMNQRIGEGSACHCQSDIAWLNNTLTQGTVSPGSSEEIVFMFNTAGLAPGTYDAHLRIENDTPYGPIYLPVSLNLIASVPPEPGDVDCSGHLDLADAILSLKAASGERPVNVIISPDADVNGDKRIGVAEAVYVLRTLAQMR